MLVTSVMKNTLLCVIIQIDHKNVLIVIIFTKRLLLIMLNKNYITGNLYKDDFFILFYCQGRYRDPFHKLLIDLIFEESISLFSLPGAVYWKHAFINYSFCCKQFEETKQTWSQPFWDSMCGQKQIAQTNMFH